MAAGILACILPAGIPCPTLEPAPEASFLSSYTQQLEGITPQQLFHLSHTLP